ncbi:class I SAM-dependent methyltransferase [uncultured Chryseobacterium sp.]|uniref:class I SAM-dependent methyltransferase n=1 Tax=uncultured Chryseobacterium sp. TaxID=259322 RepID=UPI0025D13896|nr:class I SAM-dependent methyltransferase [uncultured Chryseobacterium sp.]
MKKNYKEIVNHYEDCFRKHGDNHLGVDWPNKEDTIKRHEVMLGVIKENQKINSILDFGCGTAHLLEYILENNLSKIQYSGLDISPLFVQKASEKFPETLFYHTDILEDDNDLPYFDYIILNGVFTEKRNLTQDEMWDYFSDMLIKIFEKCKKGIAFNVMSKNVDWEREDLFHVSLDRLTNFLCKKLSRHFIIKNDYGLYEYTVYLYK